MGRSPRITEPGVAYHILNRRVMRLPIFLKDQDFLAFERILGQALDRPDTPTLLAWCLMPNHWHLVVMAEEESNLSTWMQWISVTHAHRWHAHTKTIGEGPLYQGRFKSFPIQQDEHFLAVSRYVEANAVRSGLVKHAESWIWSSLYARSKRRSELKQWINDWPAPRPKNWTKAVNTPLATESRNRITKSMKCGTPLGDPHWTERTAQRLNLETTLRPRGRPRTTHNGN